MRSTRIEIENFRSIRHLVVDLGETTVFVGPNNAGKTRVLTCRVARLLHRSPAERFRVLALTFTTKAAHEMSSRVTTLVPGFEERADIHTFHSFCAQVLRQHGVRTDDCGLMRSISAAECAEGYCGTGGG